MLERSQSLLQYYNNITDHGFHTPLQDVKTTSQMTRFRDAKVCNNWPQLRIGDHRIQSDCKYKCELQNPRRKEICTWYCVLRGETEHDTNDNVTTKTRNTFNTAHMNTDT